MRSLLATFVITLALGALLAPGAGASVPSRAPAARVAAPPSLLPWIADDWPRAVTLARARKVPIFVENWAPW